MTDITSLLLHGPRTARALAADAGVTLSAVVQQLRRMEARGEVAWGREPGKGRGKPAKLWRLVDQVSVAGVVFGERIEARVRPSPWEKAILALLRIPQREYAEYVAKWLAAYDALEGGPRLAGTALIYLFGSVARGGADRDSDIDLLVVVDKMPPADNWLGDSSLLVGAKGVKTGSPLVLTMDEFRDNMASDTNVSRAMKEAILLWKREGG